MQIDPLMQSVLMAPFLMAGILFAGWVVSRLNKPKVD